MGLDYVELPDLSLSTLQKRFTFPSVLEDLYKRYEQRFQVGKKTSIFMSCIISVSALISGTFSAYLTFQSVGCIIFIGWLALHCLAEVSRGKYEKRNQKFFLLPAAARSCPTFDTQNSRKRTESCNNFQQEHCDPMDVPAQLPSIVGFSVLLALSLSMMLVIYNDNLFKEKPWVLYVLSGIMAFSIEVN